MIAQDLVNYTVFLDPSIAAQGQTTFWAAVQFLFSLVGMGMV